jgi:hypothetical protein
MFESCRAHHKILIEAHFARPSGPEVRTLERPSAEEMGQSTSAGDPEPLSPGGQTSTAFKATTASTQAAGAPV